MGQVEAPLQLTAKALRHGAGISATIVGAVLLATILAVVICIRTISWSTPATHYRFGSIDMGPVISSVTASGAVRPLSAVQIGSQASGRIKALGADFNSRVKRSDVIAELDGDVAHARLDYAQSEVEAASAAVKVQQAQLERAKAEVEGAAAAADAALAEIQRADAVLREAGRERDRKRELLARGVNSVVENDRAGVALESSQTQLAVAKARRAVAISAETSARAAIRVASAQVEQAIAALKQREAAARQASVELEHTVIRSPIDGVVIERTVDVGQTVAASLQTPTLFTIAPDLRAVQVHANVDEADIGRVAAAQDVTFTVEAFPVKSFQGRVVDIRKAPQATQNVVAYTVVISAKNDDLQLLPGMTANARILVEKRDAALRIPNAALRFRPAGSPGAPARSGAREGEAWVIGASGAPESRRLTLGATDGRLTEVVAGELHRGDQVIVGAASETVKSSGLGSF